MEKIKNFFRTITKKEYLPFWFFAAVQLIYHLMMREAPGSDASWYFSKQLDSYTLKDYLAMRYDTWTSRMIVEGVLVYMARDLVLWKVVDYFMWLLFAFSLASMFQGEKKAEINWMVVGLILIYPLKDLGTAGWIATTMNYIWPLALGTFAMTSLVRVFYKKKILWWNFLLSIPALLYAANVEQMCAVMFGIYTVCFIYLIVSRKSLKGWWPCILQWVICVGELIFIMQTPGNSARKLKETADWMPNFDTYNVIDKVNLGFMDTLRHMISSENLIFLILAVLLVVLVFQKRKEFVFRLAAVLPAVWTVALTFFPDAFSNNCVKLSSIFENNEIVCGYNYQFGFTYLPLVLYFLILLCVLVSICVISTSWTELLGYGCSLGIGLASRVIMGFSPTLYISQERTFMFFYMMMIVTILALTVRNREALEKNEKLFMILKLSFACVLVFSLFNGCMAASAIG